MKNKLSSKLGLTSALVVGLTLISFVQTASAAVVIGGGVDLGTVTQLPGPANADYILFNSPDAGNLPHFTVTPIAPNGYGPTGFDLASNQRINTPNGTTVRDGVIYQNAGAVENMASFTLGSASGFNYSNFNVYIFFGNENSSAPFADTDFRLALGSDATGTLPAANIVSVTSFVGGYDDGQIIEFNIRGAASNDTFTVASAGIPQAIGGLSFESAPEPSTWAMMFVGFAFLMGMGRLKRRV